MKTLNDVVELLKKKGYETELEYDGTIRALNAYGIAAIADKKPIPRWKMQFDGDGIIAKISFNPCGEIDDSKKNEYYNYSVNGLYNWVYALVPDSLNGLDKITNPTASEMIDSICDSNGNFDANAAKAKFGSTKNALNAIAKTMEANQDLSLYYIDCMLQDANTGSVK